MTLDFFRFNDRVKDKEKKKAFAGTMRKSPTPAEAFLWKYLKGKQISVKVSRQRVILGYIADFYIPKARLIIECDGRLHDEAYDKVRDEAMAAHTFKVLRFSNDEVLYHIDQVLQIIKENVANRRFTPFRIQPSSWSEYQRQKPYREKEKDKVGEE